MPVSTDDSHAAAHAFLAQARAEFRALKKQADDAIGQVSGEALFAKLDDEANSLAVLIKHMAGNLRSRWTDFLTTDGEKSDRRRDDEFEMLEGDTEERLKERWEEGWAAVIGTLDALQPEDLGKRVLIRGESVPVLKAILRAMTHAAGHVGQIVLLAKHAQGGQWKCLSIPRRQSEQFTRDLQRGIQR